MVNDFGYAITLRLCIPKKQIPTYGTQIREGIESLERHHMLTISVYTIAGQYTIELAIENISPKSRRLSNVYKVLDTAMRDLGQDSLKDQGYIFPWDLTFSLIASNPPCGLFFYIFT